MTDKLENKVFVGNEISEFLKHRDDMGNSLLHYVVKSRDKVFAEKLIAAGCDVNGKNNKGETPLCFAVNDSLIDMVKLLLESGARCYTYSSLCKQSLLHNAVMNSCPEIVRLLIKNGANVNARDNINRTPLHHATCCSDWIDYNEDNHLKILKMLAAAGADINAKDGYDWTPLMTTIDCKCPAGFDFLLSAGADGCTEGKMDFSYLERAVKVSSPDLVERLLEYAYDINMKDNDGNSVLHVAASLFNAEMLECLFDNDAVIAVNNDGLDPLCYGSLEWSKQYRFLQSSSDHDFHIEEKEDYLSIYNRQMDCLNLLIKHGLNLNRVMDDGMTPLYFFLQNYKFHSNFVRVLLKNGAKLDFQHPSVHEVMNNSKGSKYPLLLLRHTAMFEVQNLRDDGAANFDLEKLTKKFKNYYKRCITELNLMKDTKVCYGNVSFLNILVNRDIGAYARNERIQSAFEAFEVAKHFPIYTDLLCERFTEEVKFQKLVKEARKSLARITNWDDNCMVVPLTMITQYLGEKDLTNLSKI